MFSLSQTAVLTLLPDVTLFKHGLQEDHVTEGGSLQDHSLALNAEDKKNRRCCFY